MRSSCSCGWSTPAKFLPDVPPVHPPASSRPLRALVRPRRRRAVGAAALPDARQRGGGAGERRRHVRHGHARARGDARFRVFRVASARASLQLRQLLRRLLVHRAAIGARRRRCAGDRRRNAGRVSRARRHTALRAALPPSARDRAPTSAGRTSPPGSRLTPIGPSRCDVPAAAHSNVGISFACMTTHARAASYGAPCFH